MDLSSIFKTANKINQPFAVPYFLDKKYLPSLDGWRAVAIILVVFGHAQLTIPEPSLVVEFEKIFLYPNLGVQIFFVLSGFLITTLLLKEYLENGNIKIISFFIRRSLRIFPVFYLYLALIAVSNHFFHLGLSTDHFIGPIFYISNFNFFSWTWLMGHCWSLGVEEQFYLIWPFLFSFFIKRKIWIFCIIMILCVPLLKVFWYFFPLFLQPIIAPFVTNANGIFFGALMAILSFKGFFNNSQKIWASRLLSPILVIVILTTMFCVTRGYFGLLFYPLASTICSIAICILIIKTLINETTYFYRFLNSKIMKQLGVISYSLYIWQQVFIIPIGNYPNLPQSIFPLNILIAVVVAFISYYCYEKYFLSLKKRFTSI